MGDGPDPHANFEVSLEALEHCANDSMRKMVEAMNEALARFPQGDHWTLLRNGSDPSMDVNISALAAVGRVQTRLAKGRDATEATRHALVEIADVYRRADRFPGGGSRGR